MYSYYSCYFIYSQDYGYVYRCKMRPWTRRCMHTYIHTFKKIEIQNPQPPVSQCRTCNMYVRSVVYIHKNTFKSVCFYNNYVCMSCTRVSMYVCMYMFLFLHAFINAFVDDLHACMHTCMCAS
jgi:hypothetical protein